ncbi:hypothetical protein CBD41_05845 [bacterium TMED181]|nr:hypothetical protein [Planctomycetota bacterium]OUW44391.1 MAG: hypothetical protein CBD41_05845 [bacterium TMED181]
MPNFDSSNSSSSTSLAGYGSAFLSVNKTRILPVLWLCLLLPLVSCTSAPAPRGESLAQDESMTPADVGAMMTGSWYVENEERRGMATLGGLLSYDMTTTQTVGGQKVGEERVTAGPLWIAGKTESRASRSEGTVGKSHWFFPFWRYREENGQKTFYPLMVIPIPMGSVEPGEAIAFEDDFDPWATVDEEVPVTEYVPEPLNEAMDAEIGSAVATASTSPLTYKIRQGDTLWSLAVRFYGNGHRYSDLMAANRGTLSDPGQMRVGSTIVIP